jgi:hypothetical protein
LLWTLIHCAYSQEIPAGFKIERYASVWERNPFTLVKPAGPKVRPSAFAKLNLTSWLIDGGKEVICVENSETKDVQTIGAEPNRNNLRLIELRRNVDPSVVEAMISDGKEMGTVKFRYNDQPPQVSMISSSAQAPTGDPSVPAQNPAVAGSQVTLVPNKTSDARQASPVNQGAPYRIYPGMPRFYHEGGGQGQSWAAAASRRKHALQTPSPEQ